jgi:hypothetical protein
MAIDNDLGFLLPVSECVEPNRSAGQTNAADSSEAGCPRDALTATSRIDPYERCSVLPRLPLNKRNPPSRSIKPDLFQSTRA